MVVKFEKLLNQMSRIVVSISSIVCEDSRNHTETIELTPQIYEYVDGKRGERISGAFQAGSFSDEEVERIFNILEKKYPQISLEDVRIAANIFCK